MGWPWAGSGPGGRSTWSWALSAASRLLSRQPPSDEDDGKVKGREEGWKSRRAVARVVGWLKRALQREGLGRRLVERMIGGERVQVRLAPLQSRPLLPPSRLPLLQNRRLMRMPALRRTRPRIPRLGYRHSTKTLLSDCRGSGVEKRREGEKRVSEFMMRPSFTDKTREMATHCPLAWRAHRGSTFPINGNGGWDSGLLERVV